MRFAICNEIFQGWKLEDAMLHAARAGYSAIELAPFTLGKPLHEISATERRAISESAARAGLEICGLHWLLAQIEGVHLNHPDPAVRQRTSRYLCDLADFCGDLGGKVMILGSPKQRNLLPGVTHEQAWSLAADTLRDPVARAAQRGVTICFEPLGPAETSFINTAAEAVRFVQEFGSPNLKMILDVKAMSSEAKTIPRIIRESWPHFAHFHANDPNLKGPGFGEVDFKPIAATLKEVGYQGYVSVEVLSFDEGPEVIAGRSIEYLRNVFA